MNTSLMIKLVSLARDLILSLRYLPTNTKQGSILQYKSLLQVLCNNEKGTGAQKNSIWVTIYLLTPMWKKSIYLFNISLSFFHLTHRFSERLNTIHTKPETQFTFQYILFPIVSWEVAAPRQNTTYSQEKETGNMFRGKAPGYIWCFQ